MAEKTDYAKYIASVLLFGSNGIVASYIPAESAAIVFWRTLLGSALLIALFAGSGRKLTLHRSKRDAVYMVLSGVSTGLSWVFLYGAYRLLGVGLSTVIYYLGPVLVMALSPAIFKEPMTAFKAFCLLIILVGAILLNGTLSWAGADEANARGLVYAFASALCHAVMVIFNKLAAKVKGLENPMCQVSISFATVALLMIVGQGHVPMFPAEGAFAMVVLGLVNTGLGCYLYFSSLDGLRAQSVVVCWGT